MERHITSHHATRAPGCGMQHQQDQGGSQVLRSQAGGCGGVPPSRRRSLIKLWILPWASAPQVTTGCASPVTPSVLFTHIPLRRTICGKCSKPVKKARGTRTFGMGRERDDHIYCDKQRSIRHIHSRNMMVTSSLNDTLFFVCTPPSSLTLRVRVR